jgi:hypothetical protein
MSVEGQVKRLMTDAKASARSIEDLKNAWRAHVDGSEDGPSLDDAIKGVLDLPPGPNDIEPLRRAWQEFLVACEPTFSLMDAHLATNELEDVKDLRALGGFMSSTRFRAAKDRSDVAWSALQDAVRDLLGIENELRSKRP